MAIRARHVLAALAVAFMIGILAGGLGVLSGGGDGGTDVLGSPNTTDNTPADLPGSALEEARKAAEQEAAAEQKQSGGADFTAEAHREGKRIYITGEAPTADAGIPIVVQRKQSGEWHDFPANTRTGADGEYSVWVVTSQQDPTFRVKNEKSGETSNAVTVDR